MIDPDLEFDPDDIPEEDLPKPGSLISRAGKLVSTVAKSVASGHPMVDDETLKFRRDTCEKCKHMTGRKCRLCTCNVYAATLFSAKKCPIDKWPAVHLKDDADDSNMGETESKTKE